MKNLIDKLANGSRQSKSKIKIITCEKKYSASLTTEELQNKTAEEYLQLKVQIAITFRAGLM